MATRADLLTIPSAGTTEAPAPRLLQPHEKSTQSLEESVLGSCLIDRDAIALIADTLPESAFNDPRYRAVYRAMLHLWHHRIPADVTTLTTALEDAGDIDLVGGPAILGELMAAAPTSVHVEYYALQLRKRQKEEQAFAAAERRDYTRAAALQDEAEALLTRGATAQNTISAAELMGLDLPEPRYIIDGILAEGSAILAGKPKLGKSWMAYCLAITVAKGGNALGRLYAEAGDVLYLALEDNRRRLKSRLKTLLRYDSIPERLELATEWPRLHMGGLDQLEVWLAEHPDARLVIIDTLTRIKPPRPKNVDPYEHDHEVMSSLTALAARYNVAIVVIHHQRKMSSDDPLDTVTGTLGLSGGADATLVLARERGQHDATLFVTGRDVEDQQLALKFHADLCSWELIGDASDYRRSTARQEIYDLMVNAAHAGQPMQPKAVADALGKKRETIRWHMSQMAQSGDLKAWGDGYYTVVEPPTPPTGQTLPTPPTGQTCDEVSPDIAPVSASGSQTQDLSADLEPVGAVGASHTVNQQAFPTVEAENGHAVGAVGGVGNPEHEPPGRCHACGAHLAADDPMGEDGIGWCKTCFDLEEDVPF